MNPPYGERIAPKGQGTGRFDRGDRHAQGYGERYAEREIQGERFEGAADASEFYARLATHWKKQYAGWTAWVLTPEARLPSLMRLKESRRVPMWNGAIECRMFRFDLVAGSMRKDVQDDSQPATPPQPQTPGSAERTAGD
jgi:putative N6-adenine-specific DNA methylase